MRETVLAGFITPPPNAIGHGFTTTSLSNVLNYVRLRAPIGAANVFLNKVYVTLGGIAGDILISRVATDPIDSAGFSAFLDQRRTGASTRSAVRRGNQTSLENTDNSIRYTVPSEGREFLVPYIFQNSNSVWVQVMQSSPIFCTFQWFEQ